MMHCLKSSVLKLGLAIVAMIKTVASASSASDYFVRHLPGLPDNATLKMHAGHITIDTDSNSNIFFWLMHNRHIADSSKLIIWLNGGPGCSSMDGVFLESGPWRINSDQTLRMIDASWNEYANVLYVDQPIGTGFSFANSNSYLHNVTQVPGQFLLFLDQFFEIFPEFAKDDMYLAGESFAGTFIPYIASAILKRNSERKSSINLKYYLKGIAIGNGWIDPVAQYNAYYSFAIEHNLLNDNYKTRAKEQLEICMEDLKERPWIHLEACEQILLLILENSRKTVGDKETCVNQYDIRDYSDKYPSCGMSWPYDLTTVSTYLRRADVIGAIHASKQKIGWIECNNGVGRGFDYDPSPPAVQLLPSILKQIDVLLYVGDQDLICNRNGIEDMIKELDWNGAKGFQNLTEKNWFVNDKPAGHVLSERRLTYVVVNNASHMVPYDQPEASMAMMYWFIGINNQVAANLSYKFGFESNAKASTPISDINGTIADSGDNEILDRYYNAGTATLIVVICSVIALAIFVFRGKFRRRKSVSQAMKAAIESSDSEMAELVIETPLNSEDIDHFGDSDEENDHDNDRSPLNSRTHKNHNG